MSPLAALRPSQTPPTMGGSEDDRVRIERGGRACHPGTPRFVAVIAALLAATAVALPAHAQLFRARDASGRTVVTNLRSGGARRLTGGTLSVANPPGARPVLRLESRGPAAISPARKAPYDPLIASAAVRHNLPRRLLEAVISVESDFDPRAVSTKGAQGLMQLMPDTAKELAVSDPFDPGANIDGGARYLRQMLDSFGQNLTLAIAAYNAGPNAVRSAGGVPGIRETTDYVRKVNALLGRGVLSFGSSSLLTSRSRDGRFRITNMGSTQSSVRLLRSAHGLATITNR